MSAHARRLAPPAHDVHEVLCAALREGGVELLPMPQVAAQIVALAFDAESDAAGLTALIERDPMLAGNVVRLANTAAYRPRREIVSLQQAVAWLGMQEIQNLAVSLAIRGQVFTAPGHDREVEQMGRESFGAALWAQRLARLLHMDDEVAYLCGLLHAVGRAAVVRALSRMEGSTGRMFEESRFNVLVDEFEDDFAHRISGDWHLPPRVAAAVTGWRSYTAAMPFAREAALTHAAVQLAIASLHADLLTVEYLSANPVFRALGIDPVLLGGLLMEAGEVRELALSL
jgi:HD-like signal output (HDOD) protein